MTTVTHAVKLPPIIGLHGVKFSGKSTISKYLQEQFDYHPSSFADPIRDMLAAFLRVPPERLKDQDFKRSFPRKLRGLSVRQALQTLGTEWGRNQVHRDIWCRNWAEENIEDVSPYLRPLYVIDDIRFDNEAELIYFYNGIVLKLDPGSRIVSDDDHSSEAGISECNIDATIMTEDPDPNLALGELCIILGERGLPELQ